MPQGRKTGGRTKGTPNKRKGLSLVTLSAETPLDFFLGVMKSNDIALEVRMRAAERAAPSFT